MKTFKIGTEREITNFAFSAFLFSIFGWALFEIQLLKLGARPKAHLLVSALALVLSGISYHRCRLWWPSFNSAHGDWARFDASPYLVRDLYPCLGLAVTGAVLAFFVNTGSIVLLTLIAGVIGLLPWAKISFCRRHFFGSLVMLASGGAAVLFSGPRAQFPFIYVLGAWVLWCVALVNCSSRIAAPAVQRANTGTR
jgi:hypothetical protein